MAEYYLMSQLPSLDGVSEITPLPITEERFLELCHRFLDKRAVSELEKITLIPPKNEQKSSSKIVDEWNKRERELRYALAKVRAEKLKKSVDLQTNALPIDIMQISHTAVEIKDPLEAEKYLNNQRLSFLEENRPMDSFSLDSVFYYFLKLKLLSRMKQFDRDKGEAQYKNIYNSIMSGEER